jgi:hypothetical protein
MYRWKARYGGMELSERQRLKQLADENRRLKSLLGESRMRALGIASDQLEGVVGCRPIDDRVEQPSGRLNQDGEGGSPGRSP